MKADQVGLTEFLKDLLERIRKKPDAKESDIEPFIWLVMKPEGTLLDLLGYGDDNVQDHKGKSIVQGANAKIIPDYVVHRHETNLFVLELKAPSFKGDLGKSKERGQVLDYCKREDIPIGLLFNGRELHLYLNTGLKKLVEYREWFENKVVYEETSAEKIAQVLDRLSAALLKDPVSAAAQMAKDRIEELEKKHVKEEKIKEIRERLEIVLKKPPAYVLRALRDRDQILKNRGATLDDMREALDTSDNGPEEPAQSMLIGKERFSLDHSYDILVNTANWLVKTKKLSSRDCPVKISGSHYLVNTVPQHPNGSHFTQSKKLENGLYIETNFSTQYCIKRARALIKKFNIDPNILSVEGIQQR